MLALRNHMMAGRRACVLAALVATGLALLASGCGERAEPVGGQADLYPVTITAADDRPFTIMAPAERIAVFDQSARAILVALGVGDRIVPAGTSRLPDLVVATSGTSNAAISRIAATGAVVYVMPDTSIQEVERAITQLGLIAAEPAAARRLVHDIERRQRGVNRRLRGSVRPSVFVDLGNFATVSDRSLIGDLVREAHGRNVAGDVPDGLPLDFGQLLDLDPDVYIATAGAGVTLVTLRKNPRTKRLRAVRNGRVVVVDDRLLLAGPLLGVALEQLARALHPDASS